MVDMPVTGRRTAVHSRGFFPQDHLEVEDMLAPLRRPDSFKLLVLVERNTWPKK